MTVQDISLEVHLVLSFRFSFAIHEAARADKLIEEENGGEEVLRSRFPLLGVPLSVKESFSLQGTFPIMLSALHVSVSPKEVNFEEIHPCLSNDRSLKIWT